MGDGARVGRFRRSGQARHDDPEPVPFATLALDGTRALYNASRGKTVSPSWTSDVLTRTAPSVRDRVARLGPVTPVVSEIFVGLVGKDAAGTAVSINTGAYLFPDGRVRWAGFVSRPLDERTPLGVSMPALEPIKERLVGQLLGGKCAVDALDRADIETLPISAELRANLLATLANTERNRSETCARLAKAQGQWRIGLLQVGMLIARIARSCW